MILPTYSMYPCKFLRAHFTEYHRDAAKGRPDVEIIETGWTY